MDSYTTYFRQLDPRVGRWFSIDPKMSAWESPYVSMGNNPMINNDVLGDTIVSKGILGRQLKHKGGKVFKLNGEEFTGKLRGIHKQVNTDLSILIEKNAGKELVEKMESNEHFVVMKRGLSNFTLTNSEKASSQDGADTEMYLSRNGVKNEKRFIVLGHELKHALDNAEGKRTSNVWFTVGNTEVLKNEISACHTENMIRAEHGLELRLQYHEGNPYSNLTKPNGESLTHPEYNYYQIHNPKIHQIINIVKPIRF